MSFLDKLKGIGFSTFVNPYHLFAGFKNDLERQIKDNPGALAALLTTKEEFVINEYDMQIDLKERTIHFVVRANGKYLRIPFEESKKFLNLIESQVKEIKGIEAGDMEGVDKLLIHATQKEITGKLGYVRDGKKLLKEFTL